MAKYRVSFKMLRQQGEELKAVAKMVDGYTERANQIRGKLGGDDMLAEVRNNLQKLSSQLGESRMILDIAGEILLKTVESYTSVETRQVKKVDNLRAHNRDFYKNPVVVASAGGGAAGVAASAAAARAADTTTINYTETTVNYTAAPETPVAEPVVAAPAAAPIPAAAPVTEAAPAASGGIGSTAAAGLGFGAGGVAGAGAVAGAMHLKKSRDAKKSKQTEPENASAPEVVYDDDDPEAQLAAALERARMLENE